MPISIIGELLKIYCLVLIEDSAILIYLSKTTNGQNIELDFKDSEVKSPKLNEIIIKLWKFPSLTQLDVYFDFLENHNIFCSIFFYYKKKYKVIASYA